MIELAKHIETLLLNNDCVAVPDLGGFVAHHIDARYDERDNMFIPPYRTLGFNAQLRLNDSLLAQSYEEAYDISYPEALDRIRKDVDELVAELENKGFYELDSLGRLSKDINGRIEFSPYESGIPSPYYYGLGAFDINRRAVPIVAVDKKNTEDEDDAEFVSSRPFYVSVDRTGKRMLSVSLSAMRNVAVAAILIIAVLFVAGSDNPQKYGSINQEVKSGVLSNLIDSNNEQKKVSPTKPVSALKEKKAVAPKPVVAKDSTAVPEESSVSTSSHPYTIVLCSMVPLNNARYFVDQLKKEGVSGAEVYKDGKHVKVIFGRYDTQEEAQQIINNSSTDCFKQAWVTKL